jgi:TonB family protein
MADWQNDLERYRLGKMTPAEMHAFEKRALHDPFLADALEGAEQVSAEDFANDLREVKSRLESTEKHTEAASVAAPAEVQSVKPWVWPLRIAASVLLLVGFFWVGNQLIPKDSSQLVLNKEVAPAENKAESPVSTSASQDTIESTLAEQPTLPIKKEVNGLAFNRDKATLKSKEERTANETIAATPTPASESEAAATQASKPTADENADFKEELDKGIAQADQKADAKDRYLSKRSVELSSPSPIALQKDKMIVNLLKGQVTSLEDGAPLSGVNVLVKGTQVGTVTNLDGFFQLPNVAPDQKLVFSFIGLQTKEVDASQPQLKVALAPDVSQLSEVVVTGVRNNDDSDRAPIIKLAVPEGGLKAYDAYLDTNLQFPKEALAKHVKGKVAIRFTVRVDGSLDEFRVVKSLGNGCDEEVIRLVKEGPEWSPTTEDNQPVESEVLVKVRFDPSKAKH